MTETELIETAKPVRVWELENTDGNLTLSGTAEKN